MKKIFLYKLFHQLIIKLAYYLILSLFLCLYVVKSFAATETIQSSLSGNNIETLASLNIQDQWFTFMQDNPTKWKNTFCVKEVNNLVILRFDDTKKEYFSADWSVTLTYDVTLTYSDFSTTTISGEQLSIHYYPTGNYTDIAMNRYADAHKVELTIVSVTADVLLPDISLDVQMNVDRYYAFPAIINYGVEGDTISNNQFQINWNYIQGAEFYELEYLFVDMLEDPYTSATAFDFDNATRISIVNNYYALSLAYPKGALIYRVRGVGYSGSDFTYRKETAWSYAPTYGKSFTKDVSEDYMYAYNGLCDSLNWQYTVAYAEEGKRKELLSFADGSLHNRLSVTLANTDSNAIVSAPVYDHIGRPAVQVLPAPVESKGLQYYQAADAVNINAGFDGTNFDTDSKINNPDALPPLSAAGTYYSPQNPDISGAMAYIPDANGYAYSQTIYKNDGTNRIKKQAGLGETFKSGSGHETMHYYGAPSGQIELDRLFGTEVGPVEHYKKNMVQDANGQISVSYIDQHGRTIATALAGEAPDNLMEIDNKPEPETITANLLAPNLKEGAYEMLSNKVITVSSPSDFHFVYDFSETAFCDEEGCLPCQDCVYDLVITVNDEDGNILYNSTVQNNNQIILMDATTNNHYEFTLSAALIPIGTYTITKSLKINEQSLSALGTLFDSQQLCVAYDLLDPEPCNISCESLCEQQYTKTDGNGNTYYVDDNGNVFYNINDVQSLIEACEAEICEEHFRGGLDECALKKSVMLADVSPGGQYFDNTPDQFIIQNGSITTNPAYNINEWLNTQTIPSAIYSQYTHWDDIRTNWQKSWAEEMFENHPEICAYEYYCEYEPDLACVNGTPAYSDYRDYDYFMNSVNDYTTADALPYYLLNPIGYSGTAINNGTDNDNSTYCISAVPALEYQDPFFVCNTTARDDMIYYLTHFVERSPGSGDYYSIWYVLEVGLYNLSSFSTTGVDPTVKQFMYSLDNLIGSGLVDPFQYFKAVYTYFKKSIIAKQYPDWHDQHCDNINNMAYYLTDAGSGYVADGYQIRWPKNDILEFNLTTLNDVYNVGLQQFNDQCAQSCELHADQWMEETAVCYSSFDAPAIRSLLIEVCAAACDMTQYPNGASVITDPANYVSAVINGNTVTFTSFTDVMEYYGTACPVISYPEEYDQANCSCETYTNYLETETLTTYQYSYIAAVLYNLTGLSFSTSDIATWGSVCSGATPDLNVLSSANFPSLFICAEQTDPETNVDNLMASVQQQCEEQALLAALYKSDIIYQQNVEAAKTQYLENYAKACFENIEDRETFDVTYTLDEYLYTLYYYDQAGNLVKTVPPQGVNIIHNTETLAMIDEYRKKGSMQQLLPSHDMVTQYTYNSLNQLSRQSTPDGGITYFWYDEKGRLSVTQNAKQLSEGAYSYSIYDALSRLLETGEISNVYALDINTSFISQADYYFWLYNVGVAKTEITHTYYDAAAFTINGFTQENLRGRIASISYDENGDGTYDAASHFTYDAHGNVKSLVQQNVRLSVVEADQQYKRIDYDYDLLSGNVKAVHYQNGEVDEFNHYYQYDADNRLTKLYSSDSPLLFSMREAGGEVNFEPGTLNLKLFYYPHGPLMRTETGDKQVQGSDYAYTLQGWLKAVNSNTLKTNRDIGQDGITNYELGINNYFATDALGFSLQYNTDDYSSISSIEQNNNFLADNPSPLGGAGGGLYNGNISQMVLHYLDNNESAVQAQAECYNYDQLNRIKTSNIYTATDVWNNDAIATNNSLSDATNHNDYKTAYTYDFNGNINSLIRHGAANNIKMDSLLYAYNLLNNQLNNVQENVDAAYSTNYTNDIDAGQAIDNYQYDEIGNLIHDEQEEIDNIEWNQQGKVKSITRNNTSLKPDMEFFYDAMGNRIGKLVKPRFLPSENPPVTTTEVSTPDKWMYTWYSLDASGNMMAVYEQSYEEINETSPGMGIIILESLQLKEHAIYGSKRIGLAENEKTMAVIGYEHYDPDADGTYDILNAGIVDPDILAHHLDTVNTTHYTRELGNKRYELTDHLGNVRSVISDRKLAINEIAVAEENFNLYNVNWLPYSTNLQYPTSVWNENGKLALQTQGYSNGLYKTYTVTVNESYTLYFDLDLKTNSKIIAIATSETGTTTLGSINNIQADGKYSYTFTATTATVKIYFLNLSVNGKNTEFYVDNLSLMQQDILGYYKPDIISASDYYPFGSEKPGRSFASGGYKYAFNGMEKDDEVKGSGNSYTTEFRQYDPRIARWFSVDPVVKFWESPYASFLNNPIYFNDPYGDDPGDYYNKDGEYLGSDGKKDDKVYVADKVETSKDANGKEVKSFVNATDLNVTHTKFATMSNVVKHESSGDKAEGLWIAHASNNAKDNDAIDWKKKNSSLYDQLTDQNYSTTPSTARTPLATTDIGTKANNARYAIIDVLSGNQDPTGGAVLWDGDDFLKKGLSHNKFKEYTKITISTDHLRNYAMGPKRPGKSIAGTFWVDIVFHTDYSEKGKGKYYSLYSTGSPGKGRSIFWNISSNK